MMDIKSNKLLPGWYVFSRERREPVAGPFTTGEEADAKAKKYGPLAFVAGIEVLNRKQRRAKAKKAKKGKK